MSPRSGGDADKLGNRYEGRWTVRQLLDILAGRAKSLTVEAIGEEGEGVEFTLIRNNGTVESHQVKRQHGNANGWSIRALGDVDVLQNAARHISEGRQFHFISTIPSRRLDELTLRARGSNDLTSFEASLSEELTTEFGKFKTALGPEHDAYAILRGLYIRPQEEMEIRATNAVLSGLLIAGPPAPTTAVVLGDLILESLGQTLDADTIREKLSAYELEPARLLGLAGVAVEVADVYAAWRATIDRELLQPVIARHESAKILAAVQAGEKQIVLAAGDAGSGKSAVLRQVLAAIETQWPVLGLRLDRIEPFSSPHELGVGRLGLPASPVASLAAVAGDGDALLVIDQLDAVSRASGRMPQTFDAVAELIREALAFPSIRILIACRRFDVQNDDRLRRVLGDERVHTVDIGALTSDQVAAAVAEMGVDAGSLTAWQKQLLGSPLNLVLLAAVADEAGALSFRSSKDLFDAYWRRKQQAVKQRRDVRFSETVYTLVEYMSEHQRLSAPESVLDGDDLTLDADVLASEHVIVRDGTKISFFHEAFFDYAFARRWTAQDQTLTEFLKQGEQELFRRAQVRQVLTHLRDQEPARFVAEVKALLIDDAIRFHIKEVVLAMLRALQDPSAQELELVEELIAADLPFKARLWSGLRTDAWAKRLDEAGQLERWLADEDEDLHHRALETLTFGLTADRRAELIVPQADRPDFENWLHWVLRLSDLHQSRALFDLVLAAVREGRLASGRDLWMACHDLGKHRPSWAVELIVAWLIERPDAMALDARGKVAALEVEERRISELIEDAAAREPAAFAAQMVPYMLHVMAATGGDGERPAWDSHWGLRFVNHHDHDVGDAVLSATAAALRALAQVADPALEDLLARLAADEHDSAQWLLYQALIAAGAARAEQSAAILLEGEHRFHSGYSDDAHWTARELLAAISPAVDAASFEALEDACLAYHPEKAPGHRYSAFTVLSGLDETRLSEKAAKRLGELRRLYEIEQPRPPRGFMFGGVSSPIPADAAARMGDEDWQRAIAKHDSTERDLATFTGGAEELARELEAQTKKDPDRFARLCLKLGDDTHPSYINAILMGLADKDAAGDPELVFDAVRHASSLDRPDHDRWIPWAIRNLTGEMIPDDVIETVLDIALRSPDPAEDHWLTEGSNGQPYYNGDPWSDGMNTARGEACLRLGDLLIRDEDGRRIELIAGFFDALASDPILSVRTCAAHVLGGGLRHGRDRAVAAYAKLVDATDDRILASRPVERLAVYIATHNTDVVIEVIERMLHSTHEEVREAGGRLAAYVAVEYARGDLLQRAAEGDPATRRGAARACAHRLPFATVPAPADAALRGFFDDVDETVRDAAAELAGALRGEKLEPHEHILDALIDSAAFSDAVPQLLLTFQQATEKVDRLVRHTAERFLVRHDDEIGGIAHGAAADAREIGELLLRAYVEADDDQARSEILDLIDGYLERAAYGFAYAVGQAER